MAFDLATEAKRALVRRIVYVIVALMLGALGIGRANAAAANQYCTQASVEGNGDDYVAVCPDRQIAYEQVLAAIAYRKSINASWAFPQPTYSANCDGRGPCYRSTYAYMQLTRHIQEECVAPKVWDEATKTCKGPKNCAAEPTLPNGSYEGSSTQCIAECEYKGSGGCVGVVIDGNTYTTCSAWAPSGQTCSTSPGEQPPNDTDGDGSSDGNDTSPNNPGQGGGGPNGPSNEDEGGKGGNGGGTGPGGGQGNGAGEGSGNGNTAGGGQDCSTPPSVTGDAALAMIAYQAWATRCEVTGLRADVGGGDGLGNGDGDGNGDGQGDGDSTVDIPPGDEADLSPDEGDETGVNVAQIGLDLLDSSGFLGGGACPDFGTITFGRFGSFHLQADWFCDWLPILRALIILMASFTAIRILLGGSV